MSGDSTQDRAMSAQSSDAGIFSVSAAMNFFSWLICEHPRAWQAIGNFESRLLQDEIETTAVRRPIWVTGLARSGSTLLLEKLAAVPGVVSQTYKDFPPVYTPYAWNRLIEHMGSGNAQPAERAHKDGIMVTLDSPEAMEEPLWMSFFPDAHNPAVSNVIPAGSAPDFAAFFANHIRKFLAVRNGERYLAKANYQVTRLEYLLDLYPDACFVIPVRDPATHIASLIKQHRLFSRGQAANARARAHLRRVGHFEFGLDRSPINTGDTSATERVQSLWCDGAEVEGWAVYWAQIYGYVADRLERNPALANATKVVSYEQLCSQPAEELSALFRHCELEVSDGFVAGAAGDIAAPTYYRPDFSSAELDTIREITTPARERLAACCR
ncbi:MAG: sulfotransferase [Gammaproteobacteria bacterium]|nr:sulfotransferase [Gammaproteobacteria bacterium]NND55335.1 sulfotransferase [Gammaproteobacteria bacterium]